MALELVLEIFGSLAYPSWAALRATSKAMRRLAPRDASPPRIPRAPAGRPWGSAPMSQLLSLPPNQRLALALCFATDFDAGSSEQDIPDCCRVRYGCRFPASCDTIDSLVEVIQVELSAGADLNVYDVEEGRTLMLKYAWEELNHRLEGVEMGEVYSDFGRRVKVACALLQAGAGAFTGAIELLTHALAVLPQQLTSRVGPLVNADPNLEFRRPHGYRFAADNVIDDGSVVLHLIPLLCISEFAESDGTYPRPPRETDSEDNDDDASSQGAHPAHWAGAMGQDTAALLLDYLVDHPETDFLLQDRNGFNALEAAARLHRLYQCVRAPPRPSHPPSLRPLSLHPPCTQSAPHSTPRPHIPPLSVSCLSLVTSSSY